MRIGDDRRQQVRNAVVDRQLEHFRVDHQQAAVFRRAPIKQRQDHGVDADRLARAGGAGDEQMRHAREVGDDGLTADRLAERHRQRGVGRAEGVGLEDLAQVDGLAAHVRQLDADDVAAGHDGGARRGNAERAGDVLGEGDDARRFGAARRLELEQGDDRAGLDLAHFALDREIGEHFFEQARGAAQHRLGEGRAGLGGGGAAQEVERGRPVSADALGRGQQTGCCAWIWVAAPGRALQSASRRPAPRCRRDARRWRGRSVGRWRGFPRRCCRRSRIRDRQESHHARPRRRHCPCGPRLPAQMQLERRGSGARTLRGREGTARGVCRALVRHRLRSGCAAVRGRQWQARTPRRRGRSAAPAIRGPVRRGGATGAGCAR